MSDEHELARINLDMKLARLQLEQALEALPQIPATDIGVEFMRVSAVHIDSAIALLQEFSKLHDD